MMNTSSSAGSASLVVRAWVSKKFTSADKRRPRETAWPGLSWQHRIVHGVVKAPAEIDFMKQHGIETIPLHDVLTKLGSHVAGEIKGGAGTDLSDIIEYFYRHGGVK